MRVLLLNRVENIAAKGKIARFEQFLLLPQCFQKSSVADASKCVYKWESVKSHLLQKHLITIIAKCFINLKLQFCNIFENNVLIIKLTSYFRVTRESFLTWNNKNLRKRVCCALK